MSGKVAVTPRCGGRRGRSGLQLAARMRRDLEALRAELLRRRRPPHLAGLRDEARREDDAVHDDGQEERLDVARGHVVALVE